MRQPPTTDGEEWRDHYSGGQSKAFMADMWPTITQFILKHRPHIGTFTILDVGCGTGHGTALLGSILRHGMDEAVVTGLDLNKGYVDEAIDLFPWCHFVYEPNGLFGHTGKYDLVISSHCIEHVPGPLAFVEKCQDMAYDGVIIYGPYKEDPNHLVPGHLHSFQQDDLARMGANLTDDNCHITLPVKWGGPAFILELPGRAGR